MTNPAAPLWLLFVVQIISVSGDTVGQRVNRVYLGGSRRLFIVCMTIVTSLQMFLVLSFIQLVFPSVTTRLMRTIIDSNSSSINNITNNGSTTTTTAAPTSAPAPINVCDLPHNDSNYDHENCYSQGPLTLWYVFLTCPYIWLNGAMDVLYYIGESAMYSEPAGVLMLVIAALASTFLVRPMQKLFDLGVSPGLNTWCIVLGVVGAIICAIERQPSENKDDAAASTSAAVDADAADGGQQNNDNDNDDDTLQLARESDNNNNNNVMNDHPSCQEKADDDKFICCGYSFSRSTLKRTLHIFPAFSILSISYALWFVCIKIFDEHCKLNAWGYNAVDQVILPIFLFPLIAVWDCMRASSHCVDLEALQQDHSKIVEMRRRHYVSGLSAGSANNTDDEKNDYGTGAGEQQPSATPQEEVAGSVEEGSNSLTRSWCPKNNNHDPRLRRHSLHDDSDHPAHLILDDIDLMSFKNCCGNNSDQQDLIDELGSNFDAGESSFWKTFVISWKTLCANKGSVFWQFFIYRFLINTRAIGYSLIANEFDLTKSYMELTLIRVVLSWVSSLFCIVLVPNFIAATREEILVFKDWRNLAMKTIGSGLVVGSLIIMNGP